MSTDASGANARSASLHAGPLGYLALGLTLLSFGLLQTGVLHHTSTTDATNLTHLVGGAALFIAGLWQFHSGDVFHGTAFGGLGAFWATWSTAVSSAGHDKNASGLFLLVWALLGTTLTAAGWKSGMLTRGVYGLLSTSMLLNGVGTLGSTTGLNQTGGWVAAAAGLLSWYSATATLTNSSWGRAVLPHR